MFGSFGKSSATRIVALSAMALGVGAGSYGVASAATGSGSTSAATLSAISIPSSAPAAAAQPGTPPSGTPWGHQRSDETLLTGDTASKVQAAAVAKVGADATVVRVETDADGNAAYEVHMTKADGTPITAYVDKSFAVVSVESR